jgi:TolA-binding protein
MRRIAGVILAVTAVALLLAGCGGFQEQAQEMANRMGEAAQRAEVAEEAAARNTARLMSLEDRIEALESEIAELHDRFDEVTTSPNEVAPGEG